MPFVDEVNLRLRDHMGYSGDGQGGVGSLPVGDRSTARKPLDKLDLRYLFINLAQTMGDPSALEDILTLLGISSLVPLVNVAGTGDAITADLHPLAVASGVTITNQTAAILVPTAANTGNVTLAVSGDTTRRVLDNSGNELPAGYIQPNRVLILRRLVGGASGHWRILNDVSRSDLLAAIDGIHAEMRAADADNRILATLADERAQEAAATARLNSQTLQYLVDRLAAIETGASQQEQPMTTYALAATATTSAAVLVAAGPVTDLKLVNKSDIATVGLAFGIAPVTVTDAGVLPLGPGDALDLDTIPATPIYVIATASADVAGTFSVPLHEPNPNWETDFQGLISRMVSAGAPMPNLPWQDAYRRLYSALRREGILSRMGGLFVTAAHAESAALVNWSGSNVMTVGGSAPAFSAKQGFVYDGVDDYHNTSVNLNTFIGGGAPSSVAAAVWTTRLPIGTQRAALGDGGFELHPTRFTTTVAGVGWMTSSATDLLENLADIGFVGVSRSALDRYTMYGPGASGEVKMREAINFLPNRPAFMGATNSNGGVSKFFAGTVRAAMLGRSLNSVQMLAAQAAMSRYFKQIEAL